MPAVRTHALILRTVDVFESSRILTLYTRALGKVSALAKGARRLRSPFQSALDTLSLCDVVLLHKGTESLDLMTEASLLERFEGPRTSLISLYHAYYIAELLASLTDHLAPHPRLFDAAVITLRYLHEPLLRGRRVMRFELACLQELGHMPALSRCVGCDRPLAPKSPNVAFALSGGGVLCASCQPGYRQIAVLSQATIELLRALASPGADWRTPQPTPQCLAQARSTLSAILSHLLGRRPTMLDYIESSFRTASPTTPPAAAASDV